MIQSITVHLPHQNVNHSGRQRFTLEYEQVTIVVLFMGSSGTTDVLGESSATFLSVAWSLTWLVLPRTSWSPVDTQTSVSAGSGQCSSSPTQINWCFCLSWYLSYRKVWGITLYSLVMLWTKMVFQQIHPRELQRCNDPSQSLKYEHFYASALILDWEQEDK